jgi:antitoxin (DNA-binding transcriptional repressor) of toxin-antitoxin stability system
MMPPAKIALREFRQHFGEYDGADQPVAVTKHGRTVGFYIPVHRKPAAEDLAALEEAGRAVDAMLAKKGLTEEELVADFNRLRKANKRRG